MNVPYLRLIYHVKNHSALFDDKDIGLGHEVHHLKIF